MSLGARTPIPVTVAPPLYPPTDTHPAFRPRFVLSHELEGLKDDTKRDSGLAPTNITTSTITTIKDREGEGEPEGSINTDTATATATLDNDNVLGININFDFDSKVAMSNTSPTPQIQLSDMQSPTSSKSPSFMKNESFGPSPAGSLKRWKAKNGNSKTPTTTSNGNGKSTEIPEEDFSPITTPIPNETLLEDDFMQSMSFSKRGSMMLAGKKAINGQARTNATRRWVGSKLRSVQAYCADERHSLDNLAFPC